MEKSGFQLFLWQLMHLKQQRRKPVLVLQNIYSHWHLKPFDSLLNEACSSQCLNIALSKITHAFSQQLFQSNSFDGTMFIGYASVSRPWCYICIKHLTTAVVDILFHQMAPLDKHFLLTTLRILLWSLSTMGSAKMSAESGLWEWTVLKTRILHCHISNNLV